MPAIGAVWNGETFNRAVIDTNEEDEISFAQFLGDFKKLPFLDFLSDFPLSIKFVVDVFALPASLYLLQ